MKTRNLPCQLTDTEIRERGERLASIRSQITTIETAKKSAMANFKSQVEGLVREADQITEEINTKSQDRDVEVTEEKNYDRKQAYIIRLDTGVIVETRALTPQEMQRPLLLDVERVDKHKAKKS